MQLDQFSKAERPRIQLTDRLRWSYRRLRQDRGLSQEELAHRVGINRNYVGMIEHEENSPTVETIERLCKALDADPLCSFGGARLDRGLNDSGGTSDVRRMSDSVTEVVDHG